MQRSIRTALIRGGTSRGLFFDRDDLPPAGAELDALLLELLGSPDEIQVDGLGGGHSHTSKVMIVEPSRDEGIHLAYRFGQVGVRQSVVDWTGNCGNLTAGLGVYAQLRGPARPDGDAVLRTLNLNTGRVVEIGYAVENGVARTTGGHRMAGLPRPGAPVTVTYLDPAGAVLDRGALPTGAASEYLTTENGEMVEVSLVDVTGPTVYLDAAAFGLTPPFVPGDLNADPALLTRMEAIRAAAAVRLGIAATPEEATRALPSQPKLMLVAPGEAGVSLWTTMTSMQRFHHAVAGTVAMCTAAAVMIPGTIPARLGVADGTTVVIGHPKGRAEIAVDLVDGDVTGVRVVRTARLLMEGQVFHRDNH